MRWWSWLPYGPHFLRDRWTVWVSTSMKVVTKKSEKLITMSELLTWKNNNSIISNFFSITRINLMLFNFKIVCDLHFIKFFCELFVSFFCVQLFQALQVWLMDTAEKFDSFMCMPASEHFHHLFSGHICLPYCLSQDAFLFPPLPIISTCQAKGSRQMDGQLNTQIFRGARKMMERWNEGVTAHDSSRLSMGESGRKESERMKERIQQRARF